MTSWMPDLSTHKGPKYEALLNAIAEAIQTGSLPPGERLPPQRELAWKLGVTTGTVGRAYAMAEQRRLISGQVGRGTYVLEQISPVPPPATGEVLNLTRNIPPLIEQNAALAHTLQELALAPGPEPLLDYMPEAGHSTYRRAGMQWLRRAGLDVPEHRVVVTGGAQHALAVIQLALVKPGDTVLTEHLTYSGVGNALRLGGARAVGVPMDAEGALPDALDRLARETGARLVFLTPTIHSPTTATMNESRRRAIVDVLRVRDLILVEDDVYGFLPEARPAPIASLAPERVIYIASASKCLAPGLRVAWMAPPSGLVAKLGETLHAMALALPAFAGAVVTRWINDGTADRIVAAIRHEMKARQEMAQVAFQGLDWRTCPGAMHGFLTLPAHLPVQDLVDAAARKGILLCSAASFAVDPATAPNAFRVTVGCLADRPRLQHALTTIAGLAAGASPDAADTLRRHIV